MRVLRLIENMTMGRNAVGYLTESMHGAGSPQAQRIQIARIMQLGYKKKLAKEYEVVLSYEDRYSDLAHKIQEQIWKDGLIEYSVSENRIKNIIYNAMESYIESFESVEEVVAEKIGNYKRKLIPGTPEYDLVFERLYEEELRKKGLLL